MQDLVIPDLNGITLIRYYRACKELEDVRIIVMSAKEEPEIKAKVASNDVLKKHILLEITKKKLLAI